MNNNTKNLATLFFLGLLTSMLAQGINAESQIKRNIDVFDQCIQKVYPPVTDKDGKVMLDKNGKMIFRSAGEKEFETCLNSLGFKYETPEKIKRSENE